MADRSESAFSNLQQLRVSLLEGQPSTWLFQALSKAINLQLLHMDLVSLQPLPLLSSLKHLLLYIRTEDNLGEGFCNAIGDLACLETLCMGREFGKYRMFRHEFYQEGNVLMLALNLRRCSFLPQSILTR